MKRIAAALSVVFLSALLFASAEAATGPGQARRSLETAVNRVMAAIRNPAYANPATRAPLRREIEDEVYHIFDFGEFSSRTVGPRWKTFSPEEKKQFSDAFAELLLNTYLNRVKGYNGETVEYTGETSSQDGTRVEVKTTINMKDGKKTPVAYRMMLKDGRWVVYDVIIENISLVKNYRTQFQNILNSASPQELTERVRAKTREITAQKAE